MIEVVFTGLLVAAMAAVGWVAFMVVFKLFSSRS